MITAVLKRRSSKGLKKIRSGGLSSLELLMLPATVPVGRSVQWKNFIQAFRVWMNPKPVYGASDVLRPWPASNISLFHMGIFKLLVYTRNMNVIFITYTMHIQSTVSLNLFDMHGICMVYAMLIHTTYLLYTWHIQCTSNRNFLYIQFKFIWYTLDMHSICNAYTHNILEIYCAYTMYIQSKFSVNTI